jgi:hypothetical protein
MVARNLLHIADAVLTSINPGTCTTLIPIYSFQLTLTGIYEVPDETILKLRSLFPDTLILAALDLVDREHGKAPCHAMNITYSLSFESTHSAMIWNAL